MNPHNDSICTNELLKDNRQLACVLGARYPDLSKLLDVNTRTIENLLQEIALRHRREVPEHSSLDEVDKLDELVRLNRSQAAVFSGRGRIDQIWVRLIRLNIGAIESLRLDAAVLFASVEAPELLKRRVS